MSGLGFLKYESQFILIFESWEKGENFLFLVKTRIIFAKDLRLVNKSDKANWRKYGKAVKGPRK